MRFAAMAAAAGAAAMYFFDPDQGRRRRALVRDKFAWLVDEIGDVRKDAQGRAKHLRNRAKGMMHEARAMRDGEDREGTARQPEAQRNSQPVRSAA